MTGYCSAAYWEARYSSGGTSGAGSQGRLAAFKAAVINGFAAANGIADTLDLGCGDGALLSLLRLPGYIGVDVSNAALERCAMRFPRHRFMPYSGLNEAIRCDLVLSIDVIFHLAEDAVFARYMQAVFEHAKRFILFYSSNTDCTWSSPHVRHRRFSDYVADCRPAWRLIAHVPNRYPYDADRPDETSFADFFVYGLDDAACTIAVPGAATDDVARGN